MTHSRGGLASTDRRLLWAGWVPCALAGLTVAGCGGSVGAAARASALVASSPYRARIREIAQHHCRALGSDAIARVLHVGPKPTPGAAAYARTWPPQVRDGARIGCLRGLERAER